MKFPIMNANYRLLGGPVAGVTMVIKSLCYVGVGLRPTPRRLRHHSYDNQGVYA
jgi:hypothetical protein